MKRLFLFKGGRFIFEKFFSKGKFETLVQYQIEEY